MELRHLRYFVAVGEAPQLYEGGREVTSDAAVVDSTSERLGKRAWRSASRSNKTAG